MTKLHRTALFVCSSAFRLSLFFGLTALAVILLLGRPDNIKDALVENNAYSRFVDGVIESNLASGKQSSIPLDDPKVQAIIKNSFDSHTLKLNAESVLDSTYAWLDGTNSEVVFRVDLSSNKRELADGLSLHAINRLHDLPDCEDSQTEIDVFTTTCNPVLLNQAATQKQLSNEIYSDKNFLPNTVLTADNLPKYKSGVSVLERYKNAPAYYSGLKLAPWILLSITLLSATGIVLLNRHRRNGVYQIGTALIGSGVALIIAPLLSRFVLPSFNRSLNSGFGSSSTEAVSNEVSTYLFNQLNTILINMALQLVVVGVVILIILRVTKPKRGYSRLESRAGLISGILPLRPSLNGFKLSFKSVPVQTSEQPRKRSATRKNNKKYRKILKSRL